MDVFQSHTVLHLKPSILCIFHKNRCQVIDNILFENRYIGMNRLFALPFSVGPAFSHKTSNLALRRLFLFHHLG